MEILNFKFFQMDRKGRLFGEYILNEDSEGVESVDLMYDIGATTKRLTKLNDALNASFFNLTLPEALEVCQASLPEVYQHQKLTQFLKKQKVTCYNW